MLRTLRDLQNEARGRGIELIGVAGSIARGDARPDSDIDIVYKLVGGASLFDIGAMMGELEDRLERRIDLIDLDTLRPLTRSRIERDLVRA